MRLTIDTDRQLVTCETTNDDVARTLPLYSTEAFELLSQEWLKVAWERRYSYTFTWLGRPIIQLPEDIIRTQEVIYALKPDVIIETGVAHGGSLIFYASICQLLGRGRVIGVDVLVKPANREAIASHPLAPFITLIEGDSTAPRTVAEVSALAAGGRTVLVLLDSCHTKEHVRRELEAYSPLVTPGSYLVATDGIMKDLSSVPRGQAEWTWDNPTAAAAEFVRDHPDFRLESPAWLFNESELKTPITHWPGAWVRRVA